MSMAVKNAERDQRIYARHKKGSEVEDLAEMFGLSKKRVWHVLKKMKAEEERRAA